MNPIKPARGIRRKVLYGFALLAGLLMLTGLISYFELSRLSQTTRVMIDTSVGNMEISKQMLDAAQEQNTALLQLVNHRSDGYDTVLLAHRQAFDDALAQALTMHPNNTEIKDIYIARANYYQAVAQVLADSTRASDIEWFTDVYRNSYYDLTLAVKNFMIETQHAVEGNATTLMNNVYRAIMPGIIALGIAIVIIVMFYALINIYILRPILRITRGLGNYLNSKIPFNVKMEGMDELSQLKDYIDELMLALKKKDQQQ